MEKRYNVTFEELNVDIQREIVANTGEKEILWKGAISKDLQTRLLTQKNLNTTSEMLEKMLEEVEEDDDELVDAILEDSRLNLTEELLKKLRKSLDFKIRRLAAEKIQDEHILEEMMKYEVATGKNQNVILAILNNEKYVHNKQDIIEAYKQVQDREALEKFINCMENSEVLDELLKFEINSYCYYKRIVQILNHPMWEPRRELIQQIFRTVFKSNTKCIVEQVTKADVINMMLEEVIQNHNNGELIVLILKNEYFRLTKEFQEKLYNNENYDVREWLAKNADDGSLLFKWYLQEDEYEITNLILSNKHFPEEAKIPVKMSILKKRKIVSILRRAGVKNSLEVLNQLLEVIK